MTRGDGMPRPSSEAGVQANPHTIRLGCDGEGKFTVPKVMISHCREKPLARRRCPYRKPTQVGEKRILRRAEELSLRNSAK
ncbi:hypothetical protein PbDSM24746_62900 [Paenibacillus macerans]|nr:hypothetical protein PbDSM24746_62900 [Paenibacillus macerans]